MSRIKGLWINSDLKPANHNAEANARLIAAAPDLLEACQLLLIAVKNGAVTVFPENENAPDYLQLIENAIKKAKGE